MTGIGSKVQARWNVWQARLSPGDAGGRAWSAAGEGYGFHATLDREGRAYLHRTGTSGQPVSDEVPRPTGVRRFVTMGVGAHGVLLLCDQGQLSVSAGYMHSLAIGNDCQLYAWGSNYAGELGLGPSPSQPSPARVANLGSLCGIPVAYAEGETALLPDGNFRVRFSSNVNRPYLIQYSQDMDHWQTAYPPINGAGEIAEWIDDGTPKTDSHPRLHPARFYRVAFGN
ncbi:MAG: hypothetical protein FJ387_04225 [Verrucomicrobia bacterium]|nr:hypothetical protein [Verrucomicrobiota bacterium]